MACVASLNVDAVSELIARLIDCDARVPPATARSVIPPANPALAALHCPPWGPALRDLEPAQPHAVLCTPDRLPHLLAWCLHLLFAGGPSSCRQQNTFMHASPTHRSSTNHPHVTARATPPGMLWTE